MEVPSADPQYDETGGRQSHSLFSGPRENEGSCFIQGSYGNLFILELGHSTDQITVWYLL